MYAVPLRGMAANSMFQSLKLLIEIDKTFIGITNIKYLFVLRPMRLKNKNVIEEIW